MSWAGPDYENQLAAATQAANMMRFAITRCGSLEGAFGLYATGFLCDSKHSSPRAKMARELAGNL